MNTIATTLDQLAERILQVDETLRLQAAHAVNCMLTARNWFIGFYIVEFEQHGDNRAQYGERLLKTLAKRINRKGMNDRRLREYRQFYRTYPYLFEEIHAYLIQNTQLTELQSLTAKSQPTIARPVLGNEIWRSATAKLSTTELSPWQTTPNRLFHR